MVSYIPESVEPPLVRPVKDFTYLQQQALDGLIAVEGVFRHISIPGSQISDAFMIPEGTIVDKRQIEYFGRLVLDGEQTRRAELIVRKTPFLKRCVQVVRGQAAPAATAELYVFDQPASSHDQAT